MPNESPEVRVLASCLSFYAKERSMIFQESLTITFKQPIKRSNIAARMNTTFLLFCPRGHRLRWRRRLMSKEVSDQSHRAPLCLSVNAALWEPATWNQGDWYINHKKSLKNICGITKILGSSTVALLTTTATNGQLHLSKDRGKEGGSRQTEQTGQDRHFFVSRPEHWASQTSLWSDPAGMIYGGSKAVEARGKLHSLVGKQCYLISLSPESFSGRGLKHRQGKNTNPPNKIATQRIVVLFQCFACQIIAETGFAH